VNYLSVCSGIESASVAWEPLGWTPVAFSEIEKFPSAVLAHRFPEVENLGDMTELDGKNYRDTTDLLVGGTPCQSFSVAGLGKGLEDDRGNLALHFCRLAGEIRPRWVVWENVPGVLSSNGGRDFGSIVGALANLGYGLCWRVLDAQFYGVAQRRRRVFLVGHLGDWQPAAAVLFEPESLRGDPTASRKKRKEVAQGVAGCLGSRGTRSHTELDGHGAYIPERSMCLNAKGGMGRIDAESETFVPEVANCLTRRMHKGINTTLDEGHTPIVEGHKPYCSQVSPTLNASGPPFSRPGNERVECDALVTYRKSRRAQSKDDHETWVEDDKSNTLNTFDDAGDVRATHAMVHATAVRRLTPRECERLQGFPDDFTKIPWRGKQPDDCPDGPRYKAVGNSMAVPCMAWIGQRIQGVQQTIGTD